MWILYFYEQVLCYPPVSMTDAVASGTYCLHTCHGHPKVNNFIYSSLKKIADSCCVCVFFFSKLNMRRLRWCATIPCGPAHQLISPVRAMLQHVVFRSSLIQEKVKFGSAYIVTNYYRILICGTLTTLPAKN
jgi:hypothetical protein